MTALNIIATLVIVFSLVGIILIYIHMMKKKNQEITLESIIEENSDLIINSLKEIIIVMQTRVEDYPSEEEYKKELVSRCVEYVKSVVNSYSIGTSMFNTDKIAEFVVGLLNSGKIEELSTTAFTLEDVAASKETVSSENVGSIKTTEFDDYCDPNIELKEEIVTLDSKDSRITTYEIKPDGKIVKESTNNEEEKEERVD